VKGLKISVGAKKLKKVAERPVEGADDELLIEHGSGTTVTIDANGKVTLEAKDVTIKGKLTVDGDVAISGNVDIG
jgi:cytoskeletal protein CcmA (bactofilin family)